MANGLAYPPPVRWQDLIRSTAIEIGLSLLVTVISIFLLLIFSSQPKSGMASMSASCKCGKEQTRGEVVLEKLVDSASLEELWEDLKSMCQESGVAVDKFRAMPPLTRKGEA